MIIDQIARHGFNSDLFVENVAAFDEERRVLMARFDSTILKYESGEIDLVTAKTTLADAVSQYLTQCNQNLASLSDIVSSIVV